MLDANLVGVARRLDATERTGGARGGLGGLLVGLQGGGIRGGNRAGGGAAGMLVGPGVGCGLRSGGGLCAGGGGTAAEARLASSPGIGMPPRLNANFQFCVVRLNSPVLSTRFVGLRTPASRTTRSCVLGLRAVSRLTTIPSSDTG